MTQALYAHMNNKKIKIRKKKEFESSLDCIMRPVSKNKKQTNPTITKAILLKELGYIEINIDNMDSILVTLMSVSQD
jgi:hypothetical protein